jgi:uncharacterized membrane protein
MILRKFYVLILTLSLILIALCSNNAYASPRVEIKAVEINAQLQRDGSMKVVEKRTVYFHNYSSGANMYFYTEGNISYSDILVRDTDKVYELVTVMPTKKPGTYAVEHQKDRVVIDWSYQANKQTKTFFIEYTVNNVVTVHNDIAELYHTFIGDNWKIPTQNVLITLHLPPGEGQIETKAWGHGPLIGEVTIEDPRKIVWSVSNLPAGKALEGRLIFPTDIVPDATKYSGIDSLPTILREEKRAGWLANLLRLPKFFLIILTSSEIEYDIMLAFLIFIPYGLYYVHIRNRAIRKKESFSGKYYRELPNDYSPEIAGFLWYGGRPRSNLLSAGILNLARKGIVSIEEVKTEKPQNKKLKNDYRLIDIGSNHPLDTFETIIYNFLFTSVWDHFHAADVAINEDNHVRKEILLSDIKNIVTKAPEKYDDFYTRWYKAFSEEGEKYNFFNELTLETPSPLDFLLLFVSVMLALSALLVWDKFLLATSLMISIMLIYQHYPKFWYTSYAADQLAKWKAFRRFLIDFSRIEDASIPSLVIWEHYLVYAVALGFANKAARPFAFKKAPEVEQLADKTDNRYVSINDLIYVANNTDLLSSVFSSAFQNADKNLRAGGFGTATEALNIGSGFFSSGSGDGGGFSGGGGGSSGGGSSGGGGGSFR